MRTISILICSRLNCEAWYYKWWLLLHLQSKQRCVLLPFFISVHSSAGLHKNLTDKLYAKLRTRDVWPEEVWSRSEVWKWFLWSELKKHHTRFFIRVKSKNKTAEMAEKSLQHREHLFKNILNAESRSFSRCLRQPDLWVCASLKPANHILYLTLPSTAQ